MRTLTRIGITATAASIVVGGLLVPAMASATSAPQAPAVNPTSRFGASISGADDVGRLTKMLGHPLSSVRVFLRDPPSAWSKSRLLASIPANGTVAISFESGTPAQVKTFLSGRPASMTCYATYFHEPEDNFTTAAQKSAYLASWHAYAPAIRAAGCRSTLILMKWSLNTHSGRNWHDWYPARDIDVMAFDAYNTRAKIGTYGEPAKYLAPIIAAQAETHLPWALTELGSDIPAGTNAADRAAWAHGVAVTAAADSHFLFADWWDQYSASGRDYRIDSAVAKVWHS